MARPPCLFHLPASDLPTGRANRWQARSQAWAYTGGGLGTGRWSLTPWIR
jgi:hypothetical protein